MLGLSNLHVYIAMYVSQLTYRSHISDVLRNTVYFGIDRSALQIILDLRYTETDVALATAKMFCLVLAIALLGAARAQPLQSGSDTLFQRSDYDNWQPAGPGDRSSQHQDMIDVS